MSTMGKEASLEGLEFDGETVLCRVCGDKASGFHYGVHACEGCKGFFRRSIQQKIQYRPCLKNQQCNIMRVNRNRCQYCRLKKCIAVGMSRDAVRFGRVPKKEKARIIEQMQKVNSQSQSSALYTMLQNEQDVVHAVINAHRQTCDLTLVRVCQMREHALQLSDYINCPANMACPLNNCLAHDPNANKSSLDDFSESFSPAIKSVVDFAKGIPGFTLLNQDDQVTLLKAGTFEVLLVRHASLFDLESNTMMFTGGRLFRRHPSTMTTGAGFLLDSMFDFAERFNKLCLTDEELALFSAVVLMSPDRPGLRSMEQVERIQNKLTEALQNMINLNHKEDSTLFAKLLMKTTDLRTLNTLHSERSIAQNSTSTQFEQRECHNTEESDMEFQDSISTVSGRSSPTPSEASNMTITSGSFSDTCSLESGGLSVMPQRIPLEAASHQQVVLRTPYGTFYREETSGFYGLVPEQPRRRCNTLDRDTLSRPRLHTIDEGNRRRYTLDHEYINKMVNRLSDRLEKRTAIRGDSIPPSISSSAASSPIPEEYGAQGGADFVPISTAEQTVTGSRSSPIIHPEALMAQAYGSSPASPRPRSGSFGTDEYQQRRRCYSFHLNSEGRASRVPMHQKMMTERDQVSPESHQYLSAEQRRGSVGAACGLHARKRSLLVDRPPSYVGHSADSLRHEPTDSRIRGSAPSLKHLIPDASLYGLPMVPQSTSPVLLSRRSMLPPTSLGISPPPFMSPLNDKTVHPFEAPPSALGKIGEHNSVSSTVTSVASKEGCLGLSTDLRLGSSTDLRVPSNPSSRNTSRGGSPQQDIESPNETFGHKKFDKFRKEKPQIVGDEGGVPAKENMDNGLRGSEGASKDSDNDSNILDQQAYTMKTPSVTPPCSSSSESSFSESKAKRSAKEAHPNLLAHLNSPAQVSAKQKQHPTTSGLTSAATGFPWQQQGQQPHLFGKDNSNVHGSLQSSAIAAALAANPQLLAGESKVEPKKTSSMADAGSKEQFHAVAVSHLKDKLMRKFDSMENLHKMAGANNPPLATSTALSSKLDTDGEMPGHDSLADSSSTSCQTMTKSVLALPSTSSLSQNVPMLLPPSLHSAVYHPLLSSHYANMQGLCMPSSTTSSQHLPGLQFAHMFAASGMPPTTGISSFPPTCLSSHTTTASIAMTSAEQRSENAVPLNLTSKMENNALQTSPSAIPVSVISETSVKSEV